jgi:T5SS/PEP-CTERM-associated repeat protein
VINVNKLKELKLSRSLWIVLGSSLNGITVSADTISDGGLVLEVRDNGAIEQILFNGYNYQLGSEFSDWGLQVSTDITTYSRLTTVGNDLGDLSMSGVTDSGEFITATGTYGGGGTTIAVERRYYLVKGTNTIQIETQLTNTGEAGLLDLRVFDTYDPDFTSYNAYFDVDLAGSSPIGKSWVTSSQPLAVVMGGTEFVQSGGTQILSSGTSVNNFFASPVDGDVAFGDYGLHVGDEFDLGVGESITVSYLQTYGTSLSSTESNYAIAQSLQSNFWRHGTDGAIEATGSWTTGATPGASQTAVFGHLNSYTVDFSTAGGNVSHDRAIVRGSDVTMALGGRTYEVGGTVSAPGLVVGDHNGNTAVLSIENGELRAATAALGRWAGSSGTLDIDGTGELDIYNQMFVGGDATGSGGQGELNINNGGQAVVQNLTIWNGGTVNLRNGGSLTAPVLTLDGGVLSIESLGGLVLNDEVTFNTGTLDLNGNNLTLLPGDLLGDSHVLTTGQTILAANLDLMNGGSFTLQGGTLVTGSVWDYVNGFTFDSGTLELGGSVKVGPGAYLGTNLNIDSSKTLKVAGDLVQTFSGTLAVTGGNVTANSINFNGAGSFSHTDGVVTIVGGALNDGVDGLTVDSTGAGQNPTLRLTSGASESNTGGVIIGDAGRGTLFVGSGSSVLNNGGSGFDSVLGNQAGSYGTAELDGGDWITNRSLVVGRYGRGEILAMNGAELKSGQAGSIGEFAGSEGTVTIRGAGTQYWSPTAYAVGVYGKGTLNIENGATSIGKSINIGAATGAEGEINLSGAGSEVTSQSTMWVGGGQGGNIGKGVLNVGTGTTANIATVGGLNDTLYIGVNGEVNVDEGGTLNTSNVDVHGGAFNIGKLSDLNMTGVFNLHSGHLGIQNDNLDIGTGGLLGANVSLGTGDSVSVSGTTSLIGAGSSLSLDGGSLRTQSLDWGSTAGAFAFNSGGLSLGGDLTIDNTSTTSLFWETPDLVIEADMALNVGGTTTIGANGSITLNGGTFTTGQLVGGSMNVAAGELVYLDDVDISSAGPLGTDVVVGSGTAISVDGKVTLAGGTSMTLSGGTFQANEFDPTAGTFDWNGGTYLAGTHNGDLNNNGGTLTTTLSPGASPGLTTINGDYTQGEFGELFIELGGVLRGDEYDAVDVAGTATLDGVLDIVMYGDYLKPKNNTYFDLISADSIIGTFDTVNLPELQSVEWSLFYLTDSDPATRDTLRLHTSVVPIPAGVWLFGSALLGLGILKRRRA